MPRYDYKCSDCGLDIEITHSYKDSVTQCPECDSTSFNKVFSSPLKTVRQVTKTKKTGTEVNRAIEESRQDLEQQREELQKNRSSS